MSSKSRKRREAQEPKKKEAPDKVPKKPRYGSGYTLVRINGRFALKRNALA